MGFPTVSPQEIRTIREALGMTRTEFAAELNVAENSVWGWEMGRRAPRLATVRRIIAMSKDPSYTRYQEVREAPPEPDAPRARRGPSLQHAAPGNGKGGR